MVITSSSVMLCERYIAHNPDVQLFSKTVHPCDAEQWARYLSASSLNWMCYNTVILDYVDLDKLYVIDCNLQLHLYSEFYSKWTGYLYPGEVILYYPCVRVDESGNIIDE